MEARLVEVEDQVAVLRDGTADMAFVRQPVDREGLHLIPLYDEMPVVVVAREHLLTALDEVTVADLADEHLLHDAPPMTTRHAVELVAAGAGILVVPRSVALLHDRKDVETRPVVDLPRSGVGLAWRSDTADERVETFIGIVRGRTARSSRR